MVQLLRPTYFVEYSSKFQSAINLKCIDVPQLNCLTMFDFYTAIYVSVTDRQIYRRITVKHRVNVYHTACVWHCSSIAAVSSCAKRDSFAPLDTTYRHLASLQLCAFATVSSH